MHARCDLLRDRCLAAASRPGSRCDWPDAAPRLSSFFWVPKGAVIGWDGANVVWNPWVVAGCEGGECVCAGVELSGAMLCTTEAGGGGWSARCVGRGAQCEDTGSGAGGLGEVRLL